MQKLGRGLTNEEIMDVALRAIDGEDALDRLVCLEVFGNPKGPKLWAYYSEEAIESWDESVRMYDALREEMALTGDRKRKENVRRITIDEAWAALLHTSKEEAQGEDKFSWARVGEILGIGARAAQYQLLQRMGFKVKGTSDRRGVYAGPCLECGRVVKLKELTNLVCERC